MLIPRQNKLEPGSRQRGFSLIELITVVVLLGILAGGAGLLIARPIEAYDAQVRRQLLVDQGEMALRQIARDVRRALPNSVRVTAAGTGDALELVPTLDGARYRDEFGGVFTADVDVLDFGGVDREFNLLGSFNNFGVGDSLSGEQRLVIYNLSATAPNNIYADAAGNGNFSIATPSTIAVNFTNTTPVSNELRVNLGADFEFRQQSPGQRIFVIDEPISYICNPATGSILRHTGYGFNAGQSTAPGGSEVDPVITKLSGCDIRYSAGTSQRGGIVTVEVTIASGNESIVLLHQIHVVNVP